MPLSNARKVIGNILIGLAAAYTLYLIAVMLYKTGVIVEKASYMGVFARKTGFSDIKRLPAASGALFWLANVTWEIICEVNSIMH